MSGSTSCRGPTAATSGRSTRSPTRSSTTLARWGVTGLWLIGLWERSMASERIKRMRGNADAVASAYSLDDYRIAERPRRRGGLREPARPGLGARHPAGQRHGAQPHGHRLALGHRASRSGSCRSPSRPTRSTRSPVPTCRPTSGSGSSSRTTTGTTATPRSSSSGSTAETGDERYVYHGNDGTSFPWNDTAQLDFLDPAVREQVIRTIIDVARRFPIIRFDAAMVLAKKHIERLWWPEPGTGGGIPSRAEHAIPKARVRQADAGRVLARGGRPGRRRGPRHAPAGRGVLAARGLLRPDARDAPRLQQRVHAHAPRRGRRGLPEGHQGDHRVRPGDPQALRQLHEQPRREDRASSSSARATSTSAWRRSSRRCPGCRCSATARSRASARSTGWSSAGRSSTSSPIRGWSSATSARSSRCSIGGPGSPRRTTSCCTTS